MAGYYPELEHEFEQGRCVKCGISSRHADLVPLSRTRCSSNKTYGEIEGNASEGELVSRVTLPKSVAADLSSTINLTLKSHDKRISEKN